MIEHPAGSAAWAMFGLPKPAIYGGWSTPDGHGGRSCHVEQAHFGHRARKATWLYSTGAELPELPWGPAPGDFLAPSGNTRAGMVSQMSKRDRAATPHAFRDILVRIARGDTNSRSTAACASFSQKSIVRVTWWRYCLFTNGARSAPGRREHDDRSADSDCRPRGKGAS